MKAFYLSNFFNIFKTIVNLINVGIATQLRLNCSHSSLSVFSSMEEVLGSTSCCSFSRLFLNSRWWNKSYKYWVAAHFHERNYWTELYLNATLRHDWTAGEIFLPFVNHHETTEDEFTFHIGGFLRRPSEVKRRPENGGWNQTQDQQWHHHHHQHHHHLKLHDGINISWSQSKL